MNFLLMEIYLKFNKIEICSLRHFLYTLTNSDRINFLEYQIHSSFKYDVESRCILHPSCNMHKM